LKKFTKETILDKSKVFNHIIDRVELLDAIDSDEIGILQNLSSMLEYIWIGENEYMKGAKQTRVFKFNKVTVTVKYE
jgi:hypothetical protein